MHLSKHVKKEHTVAVLVVINKHRGCWAVSLWVGWVTTCNNYCVDKSWNLPGTAEALRKYRLQKDPRQSRKLSSAKTCWTILPMDPASWKQKLLGFEMIQKSGMQNPMDLWRIARHFMFPHWFSAATLLLFHQNKTVHTEAYLGFESQGICLVCWWCSIECKNLFCCYGCTLSS